MNGLYHPIRIGSLDIPGNIFAAPMAGYTDSVSRRLALEGGADLAFTEMVSAEALCRNSDRTMAMMERAAGESILAVQLFGSDPDTLGRGAEIAKSACADILDLNAGCPVAKVVGKGAGAALARSTSKLTAAVEAMVESGLPVSVKLRSGWTDEELNFRENGIAVVEAGAAALGFHPRTREQAYGGKADWLLLAEMVRLLPVPVVGSGDLAAPDNAMLMIEQTGCAGVMYARGAVGDPEIYHRTRKLLVNGRKIPPPDRNSRLTMALRHLKLSSERFGRERAAGEMKKHLAAYVKGWESAPELRRRLMRAPDGESLTALLESAIIPDI